MGTTSIFDEQNSFKKEDGISWKFVDNEEKIVILNLKDGSFFSLEDLTSIHIWQNIVEGHSLSQIQRALSQRFPNVDNDKIRGDVKCFVNDLVENKVVYCIS